MTKFLVLRRVRVARLAPAMMLLFVAVLVTGCFKSSGANTLPKNATVTGRVLVTGTTSVRGQTRLTPGTVPLGGATVTVCKLQPDGTTVPCVGVPTATTDSEGRYTVPNVPPGDLYIVTAIKAGTRSSGVRVRAPIANVPAGANIECDIDPVAAIAAEVAHIFTLYAAGSGVDMPADLYVGCWAKFKTWVTTYLELVDPSQYPDMNDPAAVADFASRFVSWIHADQERSEQFNSEFRALVDQYMPTYTVMLQRGITIDGDRSDWDGATVKGDPEGDIYTGDLKTDLIQGPQSCPEIDLTGLALARDETRFYILMTTVGSIQDRDAFHVQFSPAPLNLGHLQPGLFCVQINPPLAGPRCLVWYENSQGEPIEVKDVEWSLVGNTIEIAAPLDETLCNPYAPGSAFVMMVSADWWDGNVGLSDFLTQATRVPVPR